MRFVTYALISLVFVAPGVVSAQEEAAQTLRARVIEVVSERDDTVPGTDVRERVQELRVELLTGDEQGSVIALENDFVPLKKGDVFFLSYVDTPDGRLYSVGEPDRRGVLALFAALFAGAVILFGGMTGFRALVALIASFAIILFGLLPTLVSGADPLLVSSGFAVLILTVAMTITHGFSRDTLAALLGSLITIVGVVLLAEFAIGLAHLSGFASEESVILNLTTGGTLRLDGLLLGAIIIGTLGILDDIAVAQASTVSELRDANVALSKADLYRRAMRVGREHLGAVVNTLALAYAGAALPLLLLFSLSPTDPLLLLNREVFAAEIIRTAVGGIGLMATLPVATWIAVSLPHRVRKVLP